MCYCVLQVTPTLALYDTMQYVRSPTATVCYGMCLGMGGFLLTAGGEKVSHGLVPVLQVPVHCPGTITHHLFMVALLLCLWAKPTHVQVHGVHQLVLQFFTCA